MKRLLSVSLAWSMSLAVLAQPATSPSSESWSQSVARLRPAYGGLEAVPAKIKDVQPLYPAAALVAHVHGIVIVEILIDDQGNVANARVLRSISLLDAAAIEAVRKWKFTASRIKGQPVAVVMTVTVNFGAPEATRLPFGESFDEVVARLHPAAVGCSVREPRRVAGAAPQYPNTTGVKRTEGVVVADAIIDADGTVAGARIVGSIPLLDQPALEAVSRWKYAPSEIGGGRMSVRMNVAVAFLPTEAPRVLIRDGQIRPTVIREVTAVFPPDTDLRQAVVITEVTIDPDGNVEEAKVLRSAGPPFDRAALSAVCQWKYAPTVLNGQLVQAVATAAIRFSR